jgi:hypothetical protein
VRRPGARFIELRSQKVAEKTKDGPGESPDIEMESSDAVIFDLPQIPGLPPVRK